MTVKEQLNSQFQQILYCAREISKFEPFNKGNSMQWLGIELPRFGGQMPIELIKAGRFEEVRKM